jgi:acyl dehydratase
MDVQQAVEMARQHVGREWGPVTLPIEPWWIRAFLEAVEDPSPLWRDEESALTTQWGRVLPPPTAIAALESRFRVRLRPVLELNWGTGSVNAGVQYTLHVPIRMGDQISCCFRIADVYSKVGRTGPLVFVAKEHTMTNQHGEIVASGHQISAHYEGSGLTEKRPIAMPVRPERLPNIGEGPFLEEVAPKRAREPSLGPTFDEANIGDELPSVTVGPASTRSQVKWQASSEDWEEIHYDYVYCRQVGLPDVICEGKWVYCSSAGRMLTDWLGRTGRLLSFSVNFRTAPYIGDVFTARGVVTSKSDDGTVELDIAVDNQRGDRAIVGTASARLSRAGS